MALGQLDFNFLWPLIPYKFSKNILGNLRAKSGAFQLRVSTNEGQSVAIKTSQVRGLREIVNKCSGPVIKPHPIPRLSLHRKRSKEIQSRLTPVHLFDPGCSEANTNRPTRCPPSSKCLSAGGLTWSVESPWDTQHVDFSADSEAEILLGSRAHGSSKN